MPRRLPLYQYVLGAVAAAFLFNLLLRTGLRIGGLPATLLAAALVALALRVGFAWIEGRPPVLAAREQPSPWSSSTSPANWSRTAASSRSVSSCAVRRQTAANSLTPESMATACC